MLKLIKDGAVIEDKWQLVNDQESTVPPGPVIIPLSLWLEKKSELKHRGNLGVWLDSDQPPEHIADSIDCFEVIAVNFPVFTDGRGFSYGRKLREEMHFTGELRAIGGFIRDQLFYLHRCGYNAFSLQGTDIEAALASLKVFSDSYQAAYDQPTPLFRRRS